MLVTEGIRLDMSLLETAKRLLDLLECPVQGSFIVDGGCHHGTFSLQALKMFPSSKILAFEPDPDTWLVATRNLRDKENVEIVNAALGAELGHAEFFRGTNTATNSLLPRPQARSKPYYPMSASLKGGTFVTVTTIDRECELRGIDSIEILKLDLQGGELEALHGASKILQGGAAQLAVMELVFIEKYREQPLFWQVSQFMSEFGYSLFSLEDIKVGLYDHEPNGMRNHQWNQADAIFVSPRIRTALDGCAAPDAGTH